MAGEPPVAGTRHAALRGFEETDIVLLLEKLPRRTEVGQRFRKTAYPSIRHAAELPYECDVFRIVRAIVKTQCLIEQRQPVIELAQSADGELRVLQPATS